MKLTIVEYQLASSAMGDVVAEADALELPRAVEDVLKAEYHAALAAADAKRAAFDDASRQEFDGSPIGRSMADHRAKAEQAFRGGKLYHAAATAGMLSVMSDAWGPFRARTHGTKSFDEFTTRADAYLDEIAGKRHDPAGLLRECGRRLTPAASQLCVDLNRHLALSGLIMVARQRLAAETDGAAEDAARQRATFTAKAADVFFAAQIDALVRDWAETPARAGRLLPSGPIPRAAGIAGTERLFFATFAAAHEALLTTVRNSGRVGAADAMVVADALLQQYVLPATMAAELHEHVRVAGGGQAAVGPRAATDRSIDDAAAEQFLAATATQLYAESLAEAAAVAARWEQLEGRPLPGGGFEYGRPDVLTYLIDIARVRAVANIAECRRRNVPCLRPILHVEEADFTRGDSKADQVEVLAGYYRASLQAKALLMLFSDRGR